MMVRVNNLARIIKVAINRNTVLTAIIVGPLLRLPSGGGESTGKLDMVVGFYCIHAGSMREVDQYKARTLKYIIREEICFWRTMIVC